MSKTPKEVADLAFRGTRFVQVFDPKKRAKLNKGVLRGSRYEIEVPPGRQLPRHLTDEALLGFLSNRSEPEVRALVQGSRSAWEALSRIQGSSDPVVVSWRGKYRQKRTDDTV